MCQGVPRPSVLNHLLGIKVKTIIHFLRYSPYITTYLKFPGIRQCHRNVQTFLQCFYTHGLTTFSAHFNNDAKESFSLESDERIMNLIGHFWIHFLRFELLPFSLLLAH